MSNDYNNPLSQMKAISYNLKRIADSLEAIENRLPAKNTTTDSELEEAFNNFFKPQGNRNYFAPEE